MLWSPSSLRCRDYHSNLPGRDSQTICYVGFQNVKSEATGRVLKGTRRESRAESQRSTTKESKRMLEPRGAGAGVGELSQSREINFHVALCPQADPPPARAAWLPPCCSGRDGSLPRALTSLPLPTWRYHLQDFLLHYFWESFPFFTHY